MPQGASLTAELVCVFRAMESMRPESERLFNDPFAASFVSPLFRRFLKTPLPNWLLKQLFPGASSIMAVQRFVACRHRFIDDSLSDFLENGGEQVVLLGAGLDSRALRMGDVLGDLPIIEVDFPATQRVKMERIDKAIQEGRLTQKDASRIRWIPLDLERQTLEEALSGGVFKAHKKTFFIFEGVSMYLLPETVTQTLSTIAHISAPGSEIALDLWSPSPSSEISVMFRRSLTNALRMVGEPFHFALPLEEVNSYFSERHFKVLDLLDSAGLARRYELGNKQVYPDMSVVRAQFLSLE